jgi:putative flippase GtrA
MISNLSRKQIKGVIQITAVLFGILVLPLLVERFLGYDAVSAAFVVIMIYAVINYWMKNKEKN